jgi:hypothetical protein
MTKTEYPNPAIFLCISLKRLIAITLSCKLKSVASVSVQDGCDIHAAEE